MEDSRTLYILQEASPEMEGLSHFKTMMPGKVHVVMDKATQRNGILLPMSGRISPDTGMVVNSGESAFKRTDRGKDYSEVAPPTKGARVLVLPYCGVYLDDGSRVLPGQGYAWYEQIPAQLLDGKVQPLHDWVLIDRERIVTEIEQTDRAKKWDTVGTIVAGGDRAYGMVGERVAFLDKDAVFFRVSDVPENQCLVRLSNVLVGVTAA